jgi:hypothetical protein
MTLPAVLGAQARMVQVPPCAANGHRWPVPNLSLTDATQYRVRVWNTAGAVTSRTVTISVTVLQITGLSASEGGLDMRWPTLPGVNYRVQQAASFGAWSDVEFSCVGDGLDATNHIPWSQIGSQRFYRVRAERW